jgi:hypothetical protein
MHRFLDDDDSVINSGNELWLTTVAGSCVEDEHQQQMIGSMFQCCIYHRSKEVFDDFNNHQLCQGIPMPYN